MARVLRLDQLETIPVAGVNWRPVRRTLGVTGFGINAYSGGPGQHLIEEHDEIGGGAGGHEELYVVLAGHARFTVDGEEIDAPTGTLVFVPELTSRRTAVAQEDETTVLVIGGRPGTIAPSVWEHYFAASTAAESGDPSRAYEIASAGLADNPDHPSLHYNLACFASLAGDTDRALEHLTRAIEGEPRAREWAAEDPDFDPIRSDPRYPG